jgi:hypothetical protein
MKIKIMEYTFEININIDKELDVDDLSIIKKNFWARLQGYYTECPEQLKDANIAIKYKKMDIVFVLVTGKPESPMYYCGWYKNGKPAISLNFKFAALYAEKEAADSVLSEIGSDFKVEEHGW